MEQNDNNREIAASKNEAKKYRKYICAEQFHPDVYACLPKKRLARIDNQVKAQAEKDLFEMKLVDGSELDESLQQKLLLRAILHTVSTGVIAKKYTDPLIRLKFERVIEYASRHNISPVEALSKIDKQIENGCRVFATKLDIHQTTRIVVDTHKYPQHINIIGLKIYDEFTFPDIPGKYRIDDIK